MKDVKSGNLFCPHCNKPASRCDAVFTRKYSASVPILPYFICSKCRLIFVSKRLIRTILNRWWHGNKLERVVPFKTAYNEVIEYLEEVVKYHKQIRYKEVRFKKHSSK